MNTIANKSIVEIAEMMRTSTLSLYIPRMAEKYTEDDIKRIFYTNGVGQVEYVDFVAVRDNTQSQSQSLVSVSEEKPKIVWYSAFIKLVCWGVNTSYLNEFVQNKSLKLYLSNTEFWIVLPSKKELTRTRVNVHQLASYTEELFTKLAAYEEIIEKQNKQIEILERNSIRHGELLENLMKKNEKNNDELPKIRHISQGELLNMLAKKDEKEKLELSATTSAAATRVTCSYQFCGNA